MTPFIIWLDKSEVDKLLGTILQTNQNEINGEVLSQHQLFELAQRLHHQNNEIISFLKKLQPYDKLQQNATNIHGIEQKCNYYQELKPKMEAHCSMHKNDLCENCPL